MDVTFTSDDTILAFSSGILLIAIKIQTGFIREARGAPSTVQRIRYRLRASTQQEFGVPAMSDTGITAAANWPCHQRLCWRDDPFDSRTKCKFKYPSGGVLHLIWNAVGTVRFQFTVACDLNAESKVHVRSEGAKPSVLRRGVLLSDQSCIGSSIRQEELNFMCFCGLLTKGLQIVLLVRLMSIMDVTFIWLYNLRYFLLNELINCRAEAIKPQFLETSSASVTCRHGGLVNPHCGAI